MGRFLWSQVLHRKSRTATLGLGILVASLSFTLLTSAAETSALEVRGTIAQNFRSAYDILVRPTDSYTPLERSEGLVQANYLSGIFGGITLDQWKDILKIPGVEVAAPIEMIGYILPFEPVIIPVQRYLTKAPYQLYRIQQTRIANGGSSRYPDADLYVYYTRVHRFVDNAGDPQEVIPGKREPLPVCNGFNYGGPMSPQSPFDLRNQGYMDCFSALSPEVRAKEYGYYDGPLRNVIGQRADEYFPILLAAIDPAQENELLNLDKTVVSGQPLTEGEGPSMSHEPAFKQREAPVIASTKTFVDESLGVTVERLKIPPGVNVPAALSSVTARSFVSRLPGEVVGTQRIGLQPVYQSLVRRAGATGLNTFESYRTVTPVTYRSIGVDRLTPIPVHNPPSVWKSVLYATFLTPPAENKDVQFRSLAAHAADTSAVGGVINEPGLKAVGRFDPSKLPGFSPLSQVPLETYNPPVAQPANALSEQALHGRPLLPTMNVGDYIQQPPLMLTTLEGARLFFNPQYYAGVSPRAPISVIRVRVAGVTGPDPLSLARIKQVALAIHERTGLAVDITAGSSPGSVLIDLPAGNFGRPPLLLREDWVKKGVAVVILRALDRKSLALFFLVLLVTLLFLVNGALASVRSRREEIGTLLALGWSRERVFRAVEGELILIGLAAGTAGTVIAAAFVEVLGFHMPVLRTLLVAPVAMLLAGLAGLAPAWSAARGRPLDAVRPPVAERGRRRPVRGIASMAFANLKRVPGRTVLAATGLFVGVAALALLLSITLAFRGTLVGSALGAFISVQVRGVDYLGVCLALGLSAFSVADVLFLNLRERAPEIVTLRASGWGDAHIARLVALEGLGIGILGGVAGAVTGVALSSIVGVSPSHLAAAGLIAALTGVGVVVLASLVPASIAARATTPTVLAEE